MHFSMKVVLSLLVIPLAVLIALYSSTNSQWALSTIISFGTKLWHQKPTEPIVRVAVSGVTYKGTAGDGVEQYLGIHYAQDTSGVNRFARPVPLIHKPGSTITATKTGQWCPQGTGDILPFTSRVDNIGEDCLSLGITRPQGTKADAKFPVLVWIHGGGHALGSYADQIYEPSGLVRQSAADGTPVIFVGINYRLGIFGFARSKALLDLGHTNMGLRDQRAALEWVQTNIAAFGGDPDNIISIGQSVGASDTGLHMTSYGGEKGVPFHKAVMMSGAPNLNFNIDTDQVDRNTASVADALGCNVNGDSQSQESLRCLQNVPMEKLANISVTAMRTARPPFGEAYFFPIVDGDYIPARPSELMREGRFVKSIPAVASWTTNDGAWYASPTTASDEEATASFTLWLSNVSKDTLSKMLQLYPLNDFETTATSSYISGASPQYYRAAQMNRDIWFTCPVLDFTHYHATHAEDQTPTYLYEHNATRYLPIFRDLMNVPFWGVAHLSDIPYMLNNDVAAGGDNSARAKSLALEMSRSLVRFAYTGNPGNAWPRAFSAGRQAGNGAFSLRLWQYEGDGYGGIVNVSKDEVNSEDQYRAAAVAWERLVERCAFINSPRVRKEMGV